MGKLGFAAWGQLQTVPSSWPSSACRVCVSDPEIQRGAVPVFGGLSVRQTCDSGPSNPILVNLRLRGLKRCMHVFSKQSPAGVSVTWSLEGRGLRLVPQQAVWRGNAFVARGAGRGGHSRRLTSSVLSPPQSPVIRRGPGSQHHLQQDSWPGPEAARHLSEPARCHHRDWGGGADGHQRVPVPVPLRALELLRPRREDRLRARAPSR